MLKKVLFFSLAIILGIVIAYTTYFSNYVNHVYSLVEKAVAEERYSDVARVFTSYFDGDDVFTTSKTDEGFLRGYSSLLQVQKTTTVDNKETQYTGFEKGYSVYGFELNPTSYVNIKSTNDEIINKSGVLYEGVNGKTYFYPFVVSSETESYNLTESISSLRCTESHITETEIKNLGGEVVRISMINNNDTAVLSTSCSLKIEGEYFDFCEELITTYDECVKENNSEKFNEFYVEFMKKYEAKENYLSFIPSKELKPTSLYFKTAGMVAMYVVVVVLVGLLIFKGGRLFNRRNNNTRYQKRSIKGNVTKTTIVKTEKEEVKEDTSKVIEIENKTNDEEA